MKTGTLWIAAALLTVACGRNNGEAKMTLNGCLQSGEQGLASPESGSPQPTENIDRFVLANATMPSTQPGANTAAPLYILEGKKDELRAHLSEQVEVIGRVNSPTSANAQRFDVDSVRTIAATCTP